MKNNKAWVSWHAARARAARATITQQTLHSTAWACSAPRVLPRGAHCACRHHSTRTLHPARLPAARVHTLLRLVMHTPLCLSFHFQQARSTSARSSIYMVTCHSGDPCSPSTGCCLALPTQAAQPVPRGTCSHSAPSLSASLEDTLDPACSVISALLYPPMRTPSHSQAAVVPRPRSAHAVTCALAQAFSASLLVVRFDHPWQWLWRWNLCWLVHE